MVNSNGSRKVKRIVFKTNARPYFRLFESLELPNQHFRVAWSIQNESVHNNSDRMPHASLFYVFDLESNKGVITYRFQDQLEV